MVPYPAIQRMKEVGTWLDKNGEAIYNTRITKNFHDDDTWFTQNKKGDTTYALVRFKENEQLSPFIAWQNNVPEKGTKMRLLLNGAIVKWVQQGSSVKVFLPASLLKEKIYYPALAFSFIPEK